MIAQPENSDHMEYYFNSRSRYKQKKHSLPDGFKKNKTVNEVLDKSTVLTLYDMIRAKTISYVNGVIRAGKESVVFWAVSPDKHDIALKVYLTSTSSFKKRSSYIIGDPRFSRIRKNTRSLVFLWAKKEYKNLMRSVEKGISVVKPITVKKMFLPWNLLEVTVYQQKLLLNPKLMKKITNQPYP